MHEIPNDSVVLMPRTSTSLESTSTSLAKIEVMEVLKKKINLEYMNKFQDM